jgi:DNA-binding NtrC family response regulator/lipopolysaccharide biosynthesis regulator YciM
MPLSYSEVESLFRLGRFQEIASDGTATVRELQKLPSQEHQLLIAESLARTGRLESATQLARHVLARSEWVRGHSRAEMILGIVSRDLGRTEDALQSLQRSLHSAKENGDIGQAARSALAIFRIISERQPLEIVGPLLAEVRRLTIRAADPHLIVLLHESVARQEAQVGNLEQARRHLRIAHSLLETHPNVWLQQLCEINAFCIEFFDSDLGLAEEHLNRARRLGAISGAVEPTVLNNLGHLYLETGKFSKAERTFLGLADNKIDEVRQSVLDGLARLYIATNRLKESERTLETLNALQSREHSEMPFPARSSLITQTRLLLRQHKWHDASRVADVAIEEAQKIGDRKIACAALMLRAVAMVNADQHAKASLSIALATDWGAWGLREHLGLFWQLCSQIHRSREVKRQSLDRATRICRAQGKAGAENEPETPTAPSVDEAESSQITSHVGSRLTASLASAFDLSYDAHLLGSELMEAIQSTNCSPDVRVTKSRASATASSTGHCVVPLGLHRGEHFTLSCQVPDDPAKAILLGNILRLGRAAVALEQAREEERNRAALWPADPIETQGGAIFLAEEMQDILNVARRIAPTNVPVLITGETGTGKEVLARTIHACSARAQSIFLPFNCTSTPKDMLDSQLFGHRRGAFTGAVDNFPGVVRAAAGGTLFLDEIGDTSLEVQPKLLRFLESNEIHPVGEAHPTRVDVRLIVATNADLGGLVSQGRFREDLFYRLSIVPLHLPPLRERRVEIPTLANHYLQKFAQEYSKGDLRLAEETLEYLVLYRWPGNVRQLANEMRRLAALAESGAVMMPEHLSPEIAASRRTIPASERMLDPTEVVVRLDQPMAAAVRHLEQTMMQYALKKCGGRIEETAAMLGLSRKGLYLKRQRFGIDPPQSQAPTAKTA